MKIKSSENISFWYDPDKRSIVYQIGTALFVAFIAWYLVSNTMTNLANQNIATGFGFLEKEAAFEIGESLIEYSAADRYLKALSVGFLNTLLVSFIGILLTVVLGTFLGIARLSKNWLVNEALPAASGRGIRLKYCAPRGGEGFILKANGQKDHPCHVDGICYQPSGSGGNDQGHGVL